HVGDEIEVSPDRIEQFGAVERIGHGDEGAVAHGVVDAVAPLGVLPIGLDVDPFGEDAIDVIAGGQVGEEPHRQAQGCADDPTVVGRVQPLVDHAGGGGA